jgi:hypothetical protein
MPSKPNKFDPKPEPDKFEPEHCKAKLNPTAEEFLVFCRRALGTSEVAPLVVAGEPLNGASIGNLAEAFAICYGLGKQASKTTGPGSDDPLAARRAALTNGAQTDA